MASEDQANHDCLAKRRPGEPMFIILGRDPDGHNIVRSWAERRLAAGGDPEHCEMGLATAERMRLYASDPANAPASAPPASAYASPIREPEISRLPKDAVERLLADHFGWRPYALMASDRSDLRGKIRDGYDYDINEPTRSDLSETADAILNLAPVGGRGAVSASDRAFVRHLIREMRSAIADDPNDATITTGPLDPDILERVLNVALAASKPVGGRGEEGSGEAKVYWAIRRVPDGYVETQLYKFKDTAEAAASKRRRYQAFPLVPQEQGGMK